MNLFSKKLYLLAWLAAACWLLAAACCYKCWVEKYILDIKMKLHFNAIICVLLASSLCT